MRMEADAVRYAWYGRVSTEDEQDPTLSFPRQLANAERRWRIRGAGSSPTTSTSSRGPGTSPPGAPGVSTALPSPSLGTAASRTCWRPLSGLDHKYDDV